MARWAASTAAPALVGLQLMLNGRTRYFGKLEGIDPKLKEKFYKRVNENKNNVSGTLEKLITKYIKE